MQAAKVLPVALGALYVLRGILQRRALLTAPLKKYAGVVEDVRRLVFAYGETFQDCAPRLQCILPSGVVENEKILKAQAEKGLITYPFEQSISPELAAPHGQSPFLRRREDGTIALVQTWSTNFNAKFKSDFKIATANPDPSEFSEAAVAEFRRVTVALFGEAARREPIHFCHNQKTTPRPVYVGDRHALLDFLRRSPDVMQEMCIEAVTADGIIAGVVNPDGKKEEGHNKPFAMPEGEQYALYMKLGWHTMACVTPLDQFLRGRTLLKQEPL